MRSKTSHTRSVTGTRIRVGNRRSDMGALPRVPGRIRARGTVESYHLDTFKPETSYSNAWASMPHIGGATASAATTAATATDVLSYVEGREATLAVHDTAHQLIQEMENIVLGVEKVSPVELIGAAVGLVALLLPIYTPVVASAGLQGLGPMLGIALIVFSLFGDLPRWIAWTQRLGAWLYPGIAVGTVVLLVPLLIPDDKHESSFWAFSPRVWLAYLFIVLVSLSFEQSSLPSRVYRFLQQRAVSPALLVPIYVLVAGLLGNMLDGVSIIAISTVIFLRLLPPKWAVQSSFALLFGGLLSNFLTVAAEPTNIKFQDVLAPILDRVAPSYWLTNWPISLVAILLPTLYLALKMHQDHVQWLDEDSCGEDQVQSAGKAHPFEPYLGFLAIVLLAAGITVHSAAQFVLTRSGQVQEPPPLGLFLIPAGIAAFGHLLLTRRHVQPRGKVDVYIPWLRNSILKHHSKLPATWRHIKFQVPIWLKLAVIFSLLWYLGNGLTQSVNVFEGFFTWPEPLRLAVMSVLSLASSVTDNVALAAMQGSLLIQHPLSTWQIRLLFILLTWAGGFTPFGCLQSLALNSHLHLQTGAWFKQTLIWGTLSILGALCGLLLIGIFYPAAL